MKYTPDELHIIAAGGLASTARLALHWAADVLHAADKAMAVIELQRKENEGLRTALRVAEGALLQCSPCAADDCQAEQREWLSEALMGCGRALSNAAMKPAAKE